MKLEELLETALSKCMLNLSAPVLVGVSGGPDSLCLVDALVRLRFPVIAAHFDHRLRPESGSDAQQVHSIAGRLGVPFVSGSADVSAYASAERLSIEEAARALRYRFLFEQARRSSAQAVAVGHTADDQVETVLMHLLRGAGLSGLKGMAFRSLIPVWDDHIPLVRPLLSAWREETLAYCRERGLEPIFDQTNQDVAFFRNRIRHELVPVLETYNPQIRENLWRTAQALAGDEAVVQAAVQNAWDACLIGQSDHAVTLRRPEFLALPAGLRRGVVRQAIAVVRSAKSPARSFEPPLRDVDFETVERAVHFSQRQRAGQIDLVQGVRLLVEGERLLIIAGDRLPDPGWPQLGTEDIRLPVPGELDLPGGWRMSARWVEQHDIPLLPAEDSEPWEAWLDSGALPAGLCLRRARPGDRFKPLGMGGHSLKLSDFFINQKLAKPARAAWPLVAAGESILWVPGFRLAEPFRIQESTRKALHLRLFRLEK